LLSIVVGVCAGVLLSGCSGSPGPDADPSGTQPSEGSGGGYYEGTSNEWAVDVAECLRERGWDAVTSESGPGTLGIELASEIPDAQADDWSTDLMQTCPSEVGELPPLRRMSDEQLSREYDWALLTRQCLVDHGQRISEPPSREYFIANYYTQKGWVPWADVGDEMPPAEEFALEEACPQGPPPGWRP
jgi:hypothetical protein